MPAVGDSAVPLSWIPRSLPAGQPATTVSAGDYEFGLGIAAGPTEIEDPAGGAFGMKDFAPVSPSSARCGRREPADLVAPNARAWITKCDVVLGAGLHRAGLLAG